MRWRSAGLLASCALGFLTIRLAVGVQPPVPTAPRAPAAGAKATTTAPAAADPLASEWCRHAMHLPQQPKSGQVVTVLAKVAAAMTGVTLEYQVVEPGAYVELADPAYLTRWVRVPMKAGATAKGAVTYTADVPGEVQKHRRLVRYRIKASDAAGAKQIYPMGQQTSDGPVHPSNLGYFVYDGLPAWRGAVDPTSWDPRLAMMKTFSPETLGRIQVYQLLGKKTSVEGVTWVEQTPGREYKYTGTLVVDGRVYDHVRYRARGGIWRYALGKNMWKVDLPVGEHMHLKDDLGRPYAVTWNKLNLRSCFQLGAYGHRGEQGMFEAVNFRMWNLVGVEAPLIHWVHLRIVDEADEAPADQYHGDFWGLYQAIENEDGRFLKTHDLPDGNVFKMADFTGELNHHGEGQPDDRSDLDAFLHGYERGRQTEQWWRANLNLPGYYSYRSIIECVHHYDIYQGKNYDYYRNPTTGLWQVIPWDSDLTWGDRMHGDGEEPFNRRVLMRPTFRMEYQNRLREIRDLMFNPEQTGQLIDECAAIIDDPAHPNAGILEADRRKWDYHPAVTDHRHAGKGQYYRASPTHDFAGMVREMKQYIVSRGAWVDETLADDPRIPATPVARYVGAAGFPANDLRFAMEGEPGSGGAAWAAVQWRIAEVVAKDWVRPDVKTDHPYEITAVWQSAEADKPADKVTIPGKGLKAGHTYRVRVRVKDVTGRWSHWSAPVEFKAA